MVDELTGLDQKLTSSVGEVSQEKNLIEKDEGVELNKAGLELVKISLKASLEKLKNIQLATSQNIESLGAEMYAAPVWNEEEKQAITDLFLGIHENHHIYCEDIEALEKQSNELVNKSNWKLEENVLKPIFDNFAELNETLTSYKAKSAAITKSIAIISKTLPNISTDRRGKADYEKLLRNTLVAVNNFMIIEVASLTMKEGEGADVKKHNQEVNFVYNLYSKKDFNNLSKSFLALEKQLKSLNKSINKNSLEEGSVSFKELPAFVEENKVDIPANLQDLFLIKNYFDLQPGLAENVEKLISLIDLLNNQALEKYKSEKERELVKQLIGNSEDYLAANLREAIGKQITENKTADPVANIMTYLKKQHQKLALVPSRMQELLIKGIVLNEERPVKEMDKGISDMLGKLPKFDGPKAGESDELKGDFFARSEKASQASDKTTKKLADQVGVVKTEDDVIQIEPELMSVGEYESTFWKENPVLENSYKNYLNDLDSLSIGKDENIKAALLKVGETTKAYISSYIKNNYSALDSETMQEDLQKYLIDQRGGLEQVKEALTEPGEIELEASDLIYEDDKSAEVVDKFWTDHKGLEVKMEKTANEMMEVKHRIEAMLPENKMDDTTADVLTNIEGYIEKNITEKSDIEIVNWINQYLNVELAELKNLELISQKEIDKIVPSTKDIPGMKKKPTLVATEDVDYITKKSTDSEKANEALAAFEDFVPASDKEDKIQVNDIISGDLETGNVEDVLVEKGKVIVPGDFVLSNESPEYELDQATGNAEEIFNKAAKHQDKNYQKMTDALNKSNAKIEENIALRKANKVVSTGLKSVSGVLETKKQEDLTVEKGEVILPPESVPFTKEEEFILKEEEKYVLGKENVVEHVLSPIEGSATVEEDFIKRAEEEGSKNEHLGGIESLLKKNSHVLTWAQTYMKNLGYKNIVLKDLITILGSKDSFDKNARKSFSDLENAIALYDRFEDSDKNSMLLDIWKSAKTLDEESLKTNIYRIPVGNKEFIPMTAGEYIELIGDRVKFLTKRIEKDVKERATWKKGNNKDKDKVA